MLAPDTPAGAPVDRVGCPLDSDHDGVPDYRDKCPNTPKSTPVNKQGCALDTDGDGIPDKVRQVPRHSARHACRYDKGCMMDTDGDGIADPMQTNAPAPRQG